MTSESKGAAAQVLSQLGLTARRPLLEAEAQEAFRTIVRPLLAHLGVPCKLVETFSAGKRCTSAWVEGERYIVFDHAVLECFAQLDWLSGPSANASLIRAAFQRVLAESARGAQNVELYAFFVRRALEVRSLFPQSGELPDVSFARFWQAAFVLCHEAAHALPHDHSMRQALDARAVSSVSSLTNELVLGLTGQLTDMLGAPDGKEKSPVQGDLEEWIATRDDLGLGEDAIFSTYEAVGTDPRFLDEVACDSFAVTGLVHALTIRRETIPTDAFPELLLNVMLAAYRGFLHHRLLSYFDDVLRSLPAHLVAERINPLKLRLMVEFGLRGNLVVLQMLEAVGDLTSDAAKATLRERFATIQMRHTENLFEVGDHLLATTVLDEGFNDALRSMLTEDKIDLREIDNDPLSIFLQTDSLWQELVET